jgi:hypothetical protein
MAAHACALKGVPFSIFSMPNGDGNVSPSKIGGAQFLHTAIPTLTEDDPDFVLTYRLSGDPAGYHQKVYGGNPNVPFVSMSGVHDGERQAAWNLRRIYDQMWNGICGADGHSVNAAKIDAQLMLDWMRDDLWACVVSTIPRMSLCLTHAGLVDRSPHSFTSQTIHIVQGEDMGIPYNEIHYDGTKERSWYRSSNINGVVGTEWAEDMLPPYSKSKAVSVRKPIAHSCDCWNDEPRLVFAGRYGQWKKGVLVQDGFVQTWQALEEL